MNYCKNEDGATAVEYGLIVGVISVALIGGLSSIGSSLNAVFEIVVNAFNNH